MNEEIEVESEIKVLNYIWKTQIMFVTGHYEFEILLSKKNSKTNQIISQRTIYRRFKDLEILYDGLIEYNPGCLIPHIPEKNFWTNLSVSSNQPIILKRKQKIENYLNYINKHIYLSHNPVYLTFISDDFERYKNELKDGVSIYSIISTKFKDVLKSYNLYIFGKNKNNENIELSNKMLKNEKMRLEKILKGVELANSFFKKELESCIIQEKSLEKISEMTGILVNSNFLLEIKEDKINNNFVSIKNNFQNESNSYKKLSEDLKSYTNKIENLYENICTYQDALIALIEIFDRKEKVEFNLKREKNEDFLIGENKQSEILELEKTVKNSQKQFIDELNNFHKNLEKIFIDYINSYVEIKEKKEKDNKKLFFDKIQFQDEKIK
jgi:hypothetical protein